MLSLPEEFTLTLKLGSLGRWRMLNQLRVNFWDCWRTCYLHELQTRHKWDKLYPNIKEGSLVLITAESTPRTQWPLARVIKIHSGDDGLVRSVTLKTANSELKRPIAKFVLLPVNVD